MYNIIGSGSSYGMSAGWVALYWPMLVWVLFWKAWALWVAARKGQKIWFGVLLVINTIGILEILYIFIFSKKELGQIKESVFGKEEKKEEIKKEEPKTVEVKVEPVAQSVVAPVAPVTPSEPSPAMDENKV